MAMLNNQMVYSTKKPMAMSSEFPECWQNQPVDLR